MSKYSTRAAEVEPNEVDDFNPAHTYCPQCGRHYNGSDSSGGHCSPVTGGCCQSFRSATAFNKHLTGRYGDGEKQCLTPDEMLAKGWTVDDNATWRMPAPAVNPWKAKA
jgi:hypothetical protein